MLTLIGFFINKQRIEHKNSLSNQEMVEKFKNRQATKLQQMEARPKEVPIPKVTQAQVVPAVKTRNPGIKHRETNAANYGVSYGKIMDVDTHSDKTDVGFQQNNTPDVVTLPPIWGAQPQTQNLEQTDEAIKPPEDLN